MPPNNVMTTSSDAPINTLTRHTGTALVLVLIWASAARFYNLSINSLWSDELWGVVASSLGSWSAMIHNLVFDDSHPPGYQSMLYVWMQLFGDGDASVRVPSALAGIAAVACTYRLGARHFSIITGLLAALLVAGSFQAIYYSQEARAYAFLILLAPMCADSFLALFVRQTFTRNDLRSFQFASSVMIYMHYSGFVFVCSSLLLFFILWWLAGRPVAMRQRAQKAFLPSLLVYLPWLPVMYYHLTGSPDAWSTPEPDPERLLQTWRFLLGPDPLRFGLVLCLLSLSAVTMLWQWRISTKAFDTTQHTEHNTRHTQIALACLIWLVLFPILIFVIKSIVSQSVYTYRHFTYAIPLLAILACWGMAFWLERHTPEKFQLHAVVVCMLALFAVSLAGNIKLNLYKQTLKEDYRSAVNILRRDKHFLYPGSPRVIIANHPFFGHYLRQTGVKKNVDIYLKNIDQVDDIARFLQQRHAQSFYYLEVDQRVDSHLIVALQKQFFLECRAHLNRVSISRFSLQNARLPKKRTAVSECP